MHIAIDALIVLIAIFIIIADTKKGFIRSFMHLLSVIAAVLVAYAFTPVVGKFFRGQIVLSDLTSGISSTLRSLTSNGDGSTFNLEKLVAGDSATDTFNTILNRFGASLKALTDMITGKTAASTGEVDALAEEITNPVATILSNILAFVVIFLAVLIVLRLLGWILDKAFTLPVLSTANRVFGFIFGVLVALVVVWALSIVSAHLVTALGAVNSTYFGPDVVDKTYVVKFFSTHNPVTFIEQLFV